MAKRGVRANKKALAYSREKWDINTLEPKKSGDDMEDVIKYARFQMYIDTVKTSSSDDESESEETPDCVDDTGNVSTMGDT